MYFKITYSNGLCGCDEEFFIIADSEEAAWNYLINGYDNYAFYWDDRLIEDYIDEDIVDYEEAEEVAWDEYHDMIAENSGIEEITKEEFEDNVGEGREEEYRI